MTPRARANHSLYLAKIVSAGWRDALQRGEMPATTIAQAYRPAVRDHLLAAYGWFLAEISGEESAEGAPPRCCDDLPPVAPGKAETGEITEFRRLEQSGWLAELLAAPEAAGPAARAPGNLATRQEGPGLAEVERWTAELESLFGRMRDSLDEC